MQNSFEKQVRDKMDELTFVPTPPVWQHIEKQIRTKNDRRRLLLWLPFLFLLLGGGGWWLVARDSHKNVVAGTEKIKHGNSVEKQTTSRNSNEQAGTRTPVDDAELKTRVEKNKSTGAVTETQSQAVEIAKILQTPSAVVFKAKKQTTASPAFVQPPAFSEKSPAVKQQETSFQHEVEKSSVSGSQPFVTPASIKNDSVINKTIIAKDSSAKFKVAEVKMDTTYINITETSQKQKAKAQTWKFGIVAGGGIAGHAKNIGSFSEEKSMQDAYSAPNNGAPPPVYGPSPVTKSMAFYIGVIAKKDVGKRLAFSTGLQYHYYSTNIAVGQMRQDTTFLPGGFGGFVQSGSRYFLNSGNNFNEYHNHYHFISLPVAIDWKLSRKLPLQLHAGLSLQQLISTNAVVFDEARRIYYPDKNALNKTQLFSDLGISYSILNKGKSALSIGPQLQYGITNLEKNTSGKHLYSLGITARLLFQKN